MAGFDHSPRMVEICRARVSQGEFRVHDLGDRIGWLPDESVDLALCALAIEYVDDRVAALNELRRVLRPDGALVLSRLHPTGDWLRHGGSYFDVRTMAQVQFQILRRAAAVPVEGDRRHGARHDRDADAGYRGDARRGRSDPGRRTTFCRPPLRGRPTSESRSSSAASGSKAVPLCPARVRMPVCVMTAHHLQAGRP